MLSLAGYVAPIIERRWHEAGIEPPLLYPETYEWMERRVRAEFPNAHPLDDPEELLAKEGFGVAYASGVNCGACLGELIIASWRKDPKERFLVLHHERFHGWARRLKYDVNDTDAWLGTVAFIAPPWVRKNVPSLLLWSRLPPWFLAAARLIDEG